MTNCIHISKELHELQVRFIENCIRNQFDAITDAEWWVRESLIQKAKELGCTNEFIEQMLKDNAVK